MDLASSLPWLTAPGRVNSGRMVTATASERRRPDRHLFVLHLLRRLTVLFLLAAAALLVVPRALVEMGILGPAPQEVLQGAERAVETARRFGAGPDLPAFQAAEAELARAREHVRGGAGREARKAAMNASSLAIDAQKQALVRKAETAARAEVIYNDLDREINDLEKLYSAVTPGLEKEKIRELLTLMKVTRSSTGVLFLAYEQKDFGSVVAGEPRARQAIAGTRRTLESHRK
jgi:hypothetical protein